MDRLDPFETYVMNRQGGVEKHEKSGLSRHGVRLHANALGSRSGQLGHAAGANPFGHVEVAFAVEAGIVRVDELPLFPSAFVGTNGKPA